MYNLPLPMLMCYVLKPYTLRLPTGASALFKGPLTNALLFTLYCVVVYIPLV